RATLCALDAQGGAATVPRGCRALSAPAWRTLGSKALGRSPSGSRDTASTHLPAGGWERASHNGTASERGWPRTSREGAGTSVGAPLLWYRAICLEGATVDRTGAADLLPVAVGGGRPIAGFDPHFVAAIYPRQRSLAPGQLGLPPLGRAAPGVSARLHSLL